MRGAAAFAAALTLTGAPGLAHAQQQPQRQPAPVQLFNTSSGATRYSTPDGQVRFTFDRSGGRVAYVRFEGDPEVHVLRPHAAAGGGELYRTEDGDVMLRVTPHGGITVYTRANRDGAAAAEEGQAAPLTPGAVAVAEMEARFRELQRRLLQRVGQQVTFQPPPQMPAPAAGLVLDAAERASDGLAEAPITAVRRVVFVLGPRPAAALQGDTLVIQVAPNQGYAGRPSSITVRNVATGQVQGPEQ